MAACSAFLPPGSQTSRQAGRHTEQTEEAPCFFSQVVYPAGVDPTVCYVLTGRMHLRPSFDVSGQTRQVPALRLLPRNHILAPASKCLTKTDGGWGQPVTVRNRLQPTEMFLLRHCSNAHLCFSLHSFCLLGVSRKDLRYVFQAALLLLIKFANLISNNKIMLCTSGVSSWKGAE